MLLSRSFLQSLAVTSKQPRRIPLARLYSTDEKEPSNEDQVSPMLIRAEDDDVPSPLDRAKAIIEKSLSRPTLPKFFPELPSVYLTRRPVFPGFYKTISLKDQGIIDSLQERISTGKVYLGLFLKRASEDADGTGIFTDPKEVHDIGVVSQLINIIPTGRDGATAVLYPHRRIKLDSIISSDPPFPFIQAHTLLDEPVDYKSRVFKALSQEIFVVLSDISKLNPFFREHITHHNVSTSVFDDPSKLADFIAILCSGEAEELQGVLSELDIEARMRKSLMLLKKELQTAQLQHNISKDIEQKIGQKQKEYFLHEQLKAIKKELGMESDGKEKLLSNYRKLRSELDLPEIAANVYEEEISRLSSLDAASTEFSMCRNYLDWICHLPWNKTIEEAYDIDKTKKIIESSHSGMEDVKQRILEFVAVSKLKNSTQGKILCFIGPPGVGKTSIGKSIAEALGRKFYRFSVGGLSDVAEIKGHRRTYVGSMPGKLIQALRRTESKNPVILIDEVDKIGKGYQGDPTSALLEVLDPEQNSQFNDHYLDIPFDLSQVLFICTANVMDTIPGPLLDRMEVINISGYTTEEKIDIARKFLLPKLLAETGLGADFVEISNMALAGLIKGYCRESGVRSLKHKLEQILRKIAIKRAEGNNDKISIGECDISKYIGPPIYRSERIHVEKFLPVGLSTGLAWTSAGGSILYIETMADSGSVDGKPQHTFKFTGQMGKVMEESCFIALSFVRSFLRKLEPKSTFFDSSSIHLHVPEGATPKDGPSAGCAMAVSLLSSALGKGISSEIAMTGELTLTGKVLPVGGIREKVVAAKRSSIHTIILPKSNGADWEKLPEYIKSGLTLHLVEDFNEIAQLCGLSK